MLSNCRRPSLVGAHLFVTFFQFARRSEAAPTPPTVWRFGGGATEASDATAGASGLFVSMTT